jgi:hypothetical protein
VSTETQNRSLGVVETEELDFLVGGDTRELQGDVVGLPVRDAQVVGHLLAGDDGRPGLLEAEEAEEGDGTVEVLDGDGHVVEAAVP